MRKITTPALSTADADLIDRLRLGEPDALASVYQQYFPSLHSMFTRITRDERAADDLTQDLFLRLSSRMQMFDSTKGTLETWLRSVGRNMAIDQMRSPSAHHERLRVPSEHIEHVRCAGDPGSDLQRKIFVREMMLSLDAPRRHLLELAYFHGYSHLEIAALVQKPLGTIKSAIRTAIIELSLALRASNRRFVRRELAHRP